MSEKKTIEEKIEFIEKMKEGNPQAFAFLAHGAASLVSQIETDLLLEFREWAKRALRIMSYAKTHILISEILSETARQEK